MRKVQKMEPRSKRFYIILSVVAALATMTVKFIGYFLTGSVGLFSDAAESVVNLVAGASEIRIGAFVAGTILGMLPGWILMSALGHQIMRIISAPSAADLALLAVVIAVWIALAGGVQLVFARFGPRP